MAKYLVEPVIGGGQITTTTIPLAAAVAPGTQYWDSVLGTFLTSDGTTYNQLNPRRLLLQNPIQMIIPSSGTLSAAGALSGLTALPAIYANAFMYFPANAIATVSVAGFRFVQMSSATAGTVFQNTYTSGVPAIPATSALIPCTTASNYTQDTATTISQISLSIPANIMGTLGKIAISCFWTANNTAGTKTIGISFGGTSILTSAQSTNLSLSIIRNIVNIGATNAQMTDGAVGSAGPGFAAAAPIYFSVDTTTALNLLFTNNLQTATDFSVLGFTTVEVIPQG